MTRWWLSRLPLQVLVVIVLLLGGTAGYHCIEGWTLFDGLYMTVITLSTIGYGETHPLSNPGRVFTILLILGGVFTFFYVMTDLIRSIVSGEMAQQLGKQKMEKSLEQIRDHVIVCGYGRMGRLVCREFAQDGIPFVLVDRDPQVLADCEPTVELALAGDATSDELLKRAGIHRARSLVAVMRSDADNLFTTLSARLLAPQLFIVARVEDMESEQKMLRAGANRVVSPYHIGGVRVAQAVLRPTVVDFIELATRTEHIELQLEEIRIAPGSSLAGNTLLESRLRVDLKIIIVAIKKPRGHMVFNPAPETTLDASDILVAIGHREQLNQARALAEPAAPA